MGYPRRVDPKTRDLLVWVGGALLVVGLVLAWLWFDRPEEDLLPQQYRYGVL